MKLPHQCSVPMRAGCGIRLSDDDVTPVPDSLTICGLLAALSAMVSEPVSLPTFAGVNVTEILQFPPATTLDPQLFVAAKSPVATILETARGTA